MQQSLCLPLKAVSSPQVADLFLRFSSAVSIVGAVGTVVSKKWLLSHEVEFLADKHFKYEYGFYFYFYFVFQSNSVPPSTQDIHPSLFPCRVGRGARKGNLHKSCSIPTTPGTDPLESVIPPPSMVLFSANFRILGENPQWKFANNDNGKK